MARRSSQVGDFLNYILQHSASEIKTEGDLVRLRAANPALYQTVWNGSGKYSQARGKGTHGSIAQMSNGQRIISLFESADESTFLHEMGHMFLMDFEDLAVIDDISAKELEVVKDWASWKKGDAKQYKNTPWEKEFRQREQQIIDAEEHQDIEEAKKLKRIWEQERFARAF